jgi:hypothetical protein
MLRYPYGSIRAGPAFRITGDDGNMTKTPLRAGWLCAALLLSSSATSLATDAPAALPDAPSVSAADDKTPPQSQPPQTKEAPQDKVLKKPSFFFPDLATSRAPLSPRQKFSLFAMNSISPATIVGSVFGAAFGQATNTPSGYGQGGEGYGKRFGAGMATRASTNLFGTFLIPTLARQDPRYFVHGDGTFGERLGHAVSRVVVAPSDDGGYGFNWGGVFGPLAAETLANTYQPAREQTGGRTLMRYGTDMASKAGINVLKEFWPDIFRHLGLKK